MKEPVTYGKFETHIFEVVFKNTTELVDKLQNPDCQSLVCVDPNCENQADWNPAGGGILLFNTDQLREWMKEKRQGTLNVHWYCGYMRVVMNLKSLKEQKAVITAFEKAVKQLNGELGTNFQVKVEKDGSARPYMTA